MSEAFPVPFHTLIKPCYAKALEGSRLFPGPKAKSSSEIMNSTPFTINCQQCVCFHATLQFVPPSPSPAVSTCLFVCLHLHCCPENRSISTIFLDFIYMHCTVLSCSVVWLWDLMDCSLPGSSVLGDSPGYNTRVGCHSLLQGIFPTQGSNQGLLHCKQILYHLRHQGRPYLCINKQYLSFSFWLTSLCIRATVFTILY